MLVRQAADPGGDGMRFHFEFSMDLFLLMGTLPSPPDAPMKRVGTPLMVPFLKLLTEPQCAAAVTCVQVFAASVVS